MSGRPAAFVRFRHPRRIRRFVWGLVGATGVLVGAASLAFAQPPPRVENPVSNPTLNARCGLKIMLVLDESNSIYTGFGTPPGVNFYTEDVRRAATAFVHSFEGTDSPLAITAFHSFSRAGVPEAETHTGYQPVTEQNINTFTDWINNSNQPTGVTGYRPVPSSELRTSNSVTFTPQPSPNGTTNWEDSFDEVGRTAGGPPNLVVFVTDGDPNTVNAINAPGGPGNSVGQTWNPATPTGSGYRFLSPQNQINYNNATQAAVPSANDVKRTQAKIFGIGVGPAVDNTQSAARIEDVSGPREGASPINADYYLVSNFSDLDEELAAMGARLCGSSLTITKNVFHSNGVTYSPAAGWHFTATLTPSGHEWLRPASAGTNPSARETTTLPYGRAEFLWKFATAPSQPPRLTKVQEAPEAHYRFVLARCETHAVENGTEVILDKAESTTHIPPANVGTEQYRTCEVWNMHDEPVTPPPDGGEGACDDPSCGDAAEEPHLRISKHLPAHAHVGQRVRITITVRNVGHAKAHDVQVHETRFPGLRIVAVHNHGSIQHDGSVLWHLGDLRAGERRTLHAIALVTRPGTHPDLAVASASNAGPVVDSARVRARRRTRPPRSPADPGARTPHTPGPNAWPRNSIALG